jgi:poly(A)-specific ribonuclease
MRLNYFSFYFLCCRFVGPGQQSNDFLLHLPRADFVAIDEEMTGISLPSQGRPRKEQTPTERYGAQKLIPERYSIIQLGVSVHKGHSVRKYNFYMFPADSSSREIVLNPSAVHFLNQHSMSFDVWSKSGIAYCTREQAMDTTAKYLAAELKQQAEAAAAAASAANGAQKQPSVQEALTRRVELRRSEDVAFVARTMASVREWLDTGMVPLTARAGGGGGAAAPDESNQTQFLLPACNSFLRRALYENISKEYPSLILESVAQDPAASANGNNVNRNHTQIRILRLTPDELELRRERLQAERWEQFVVEKIGMWRVVSALRQVCCGFALDYSIPQWSPSAAHVDWSHGTSGPRMMSPLGRRIPLVMHNGWMDLLFLMTHFESPRLPATLFECKRLIRSYFPMIYDTKVLSVEYCGYGASNLGCLYLAAGESDLDIVKMSEGGGETFDTIEDAEAHQADYDAYMTGAVFVGLSKHLKPVERIDEQEEGEVDDDGSSSREERVQWFASTLGCNRIYNLGLFTLDLEGAVDPLAVGITPDSSFRVAGIDPSITTTDIVSCLNNLKDDRDRPANFDLVWVDDTTFIVATRYRPNADDTVGSLLSSSDVDVENTVILRDHGLLVRRALESRFGADSITTLGEYFEQQKPGVEAKGGFFTRFLEFMRLKRKPERAMAEDDRPSKRQRKN